MKLSQVLFFLPSALALPSLHSLGNVDISISIHDAGVTDASETCWELLSPMDPVCPEGWEIVRLGDTGFSTCCLINGDDDLMVVQDKTVSQRLDVLPPCTSQCSECAMVCDIATRKCYNACIDPQVSRATQKGL